MSDNKFCNNHPNAKAIESCHHCAINLCGMCANFIDAIVLCEACSETYEAEKFVSTQSEKLERSESTMVVDEPASLEFNPPTRRKSSSKAIQWAVITASFCIITAQLYFYSSPPQIQQEPSALAREQQLNSLVQCMLVFREIGLILQEGGLPGNDMRCADSAAANISRNEEGTIRFYHPNPQYYGYEEISVGDDSPEPKLVLRNSNSEL